MRAFYSLFLKAALVIGLLLYIPVQADELPDTLQLKEVEIKISQLPSGLKMGRIGQVTLAGEQIKRGFRVLGEADGLKQMLTIPGFSSAGDYSGGVSVDGAHYSQTSTTLDGGTVFFPYHFGGIFSTFNAALLSRMESQRSSSRADSPLRLAGSIQGFTADSLVTAPHGEASLGVIAASGAIALPLSDRFTVRLGVRQSFLDLLCGGLLNSSDEKFQYSFTDANLSATWKINDNNRLIMSGFCNFDNLKLNDYNYGLNGKMKWNNLVALMRYEHLTNDWNISQTAGYSQFANTVMLLMPQVECRIPSAINQFLSLTSLHNDKTKFYIDFRNELNLIMPQYASCTGALSINNVKSHVTAGMSSLSLCKKIRLTENFLMEVSGRLSLIAGSDRCFFVMDPYANVSYFKGPSIWTVETFTSTQDLHLLGLSDIGLSSNFWLPSSKISPPQRAYGFGMNYTYSGRFITPMVRIFYKRIHNMAEFNGNLFSLLTDDYSYQDRIQSLNGFNTGLDAMLTFRAGRLSGWLGYSLAYCRLRYPQAAFRLLPSSSEPLNQLKASLSMQVSHKVSLNAFFCLTSGRPYTAIKNVYLMAGNVMAEYGDPNSARLPAYHRLDLSATWTLPKHGFLNFSLLNVYGHRNVEMIYYTYDANKSSIRLKNSYSLYRFLPSVSYTIQF